MSSETYLSGEHNVFEKRTLCWLCVPPLYSIRAGRRRRRRCRMTTSTAAALTVMIATVRLQLFASCSVRRRYISVFTCVRIYYSDIFTRKDSLCTERVVLQIPAANGGRCTRTKEVEPILWHDFGITSTRNVFVRSVARTPIVHVVHVVCKWVCNSQQPTPTPTQTHRHKKVTSSRFGQLTSCCTSVCASWPSASHPRAKQPYNKTARIDYVFFRLALELCMATDQMYFMAQ